MEDPVLKVLRETRCKECNVYAYNCMCAIIDEINQPERSKREDLNFKQLADEFYNSYVTKDLLTNWEEENGALKILDKFAEWLDSRCGALNTAVTS